MDWKLKGFVHSGITVKDLKRSIDFYENSLGLELVRLQTNDKPYIYDLVNIQGLEKIELAFLQTPDGQIVELLEYHGETIKDGSSLHSHYGTGHICLHVENLDAMYEHLQRRNTDIISEHVVQITSGRHAGSKAIYLRDPDGYVIEVLEYI